MTQPHEVMDQLFDFDEETVKTALAVFGGKWKPSILWHLRNSPCRFNELLRRMPKITKKMLVQQLRDLEHEEIILRQVHQVMPPKVEYSLTEYGRTLCPVFQILQNWGENHLQGREIKYPHLKWDTLKESDT